MPKEKEKRLDPAGEREFLANISRRMVHRTDSDDPACEPDPGDNIGFADDLDALKAQKLIACPLCLRGEYF